MKAEVDERGEYEQAVNALHGLSIDQIEFREIVEAFESIGIFYSARDTRRMRANYDNMATLVYACSEPGCSSYMKFTITHNVVTHVETDWEHSHPLNVLRCRTVTCSVCNNSGHNKRTCPVEKGRSTVRRYFRENQTDDLNRIIANVITEGWTLLGISCRDMIHLVSIIPLQNPHLVRVFFFFAPNDDIGIMGKKRLYAKIVRSQDGRTPCLSRDLQCLYSTRGYEDRSNLVYALTWYAHYAVVVNGEDTSIFAEVKAQLIHHYGCTPPGELNSTMHLFTSALREAILIIEESCTVVTYISNGTLTVNAENMISVSRSLVPNFLCRIHMQGRMQRPPDNILCGCWTVKTLVIDDNQLLTHNGLSSLKTAEIIRRQIIVSD